MRRYLQTFALITSLAVLLFSALPVHAEDAPYFLSWSQKGELIKSGTIEENGQWYNVWLVPGYRDPWQYAGDRWRGAGDQLRDYGDPAKYRSMVEDGKTVIRWGNEQAMQEYAVAGSAEAWRKYLATARSQTEQRVFGWWLSYPWASFKGTVNTTWRYLAGTSGWVGAYAVGLVGSPVYHSVDSLLMATVEASVGGVVLPGSAALWNTVVAPPLALAGQRPAPERVDGFWVTMIDDPYDAPQPLTEASRADVLAFARHLDRASQAAPQPDQTARQALEQQLAELERRRADLQARLDGLALKDLHVREAHITAEADAWLAAHPDSVVATDWDRWWRRHGVEMQRDLRAEFGERADRVRSLLNTHTSLTPPAGRAQGFEQSTDPLRESLNELERALD